MSVISSGSVDYAPNSPGSHDFTIADRNLSREYNKKAMEYTQKLQD